MFGLRGELSRKLISIRMPPHRVALNCQACLSVSLYCLGIDVCWRGRAPHVLNKWHRW